MGEELFYVLCFVAAILLAAAVGQYASDPDDLEQMPHSGAIYCATGSVILLVIAYSVAPQSEDSDGGEQRYQSVELDERLPVMRAVVKVNQPVYAAAAVVSGLEDVTTGNAREGVAKSAVAQGMDLKEVAKEEPRAFQTEKYKKLEQHIDDYLNGGLRATVNKTKRVCLPDNKCYMVRQTCSKTMQAE